MLTIYTAAYSLKLSRFGTLLAGTPAVALLRLKPITMELQAQFPEHRATRLHATRLHATELQKTCVRSPKRGDRGVLIAAGRQSENGIVFTVSPVIFVYRTQHPLLVVSFRD